MVVEEIPSFKSKMYDMYFDSRLVNYKCSKRPANPDIQIGQIISHFYDSAEYASCSLLLFSAYKFIDDISEPFMLVDMAYYFGRLSFKDEFFSCLKRLSNFNVKMSAEAYQNIGAVLCDSFFDYEHAIEFFTGALRMKPELWQPKQSIFVAGKYRILELCNEEKANEAYQLGEKIRSLVGTYTSDDHGFYSYLGLAAEIIGYKDQAEKHYRMALKLEPDCKVANTGLKRLETPDYNTGDAQRAVYWESEGATIQRLRKTDELFSLDLDAAK